MHIIIKCEIYTETTILDTVWDKALLEFVRVPTNCKQSSDQCWSEYIVEPESGMINTPICFVFYSYNTGHECHRE